MDRAEYKHDIETHQTTQNAIRETATATVSFDIIRIPAHEGPLTQLVIRTRRPQFACSFIQRAVHIQEMSFRNMDNMNRAPANPLPYRPQRRERREVERFGLWNFFCRQDEGEADEVMMMLSWTDATRDQNKNKNKNKNKNNDEQTQNKKTSRKSGTLVCATVRLEVRYLSLIKLPGCSSQYLTHFCSFRCSEIHNLGRIFYRVPPVPQKHVLGSFGNGVD